MVVRASKCISSLWCHPTRSHTPPRLKLQMFCPGMGGGHPPSCLTWCETQLEPFFVPIGQPQKTKQETSLMWLFSRPPCTSHPPKKTHSERSLVRVHMGNLPTASRSQEAEPRQRYFFILPFTYSASSQFPSNLSKTLKTPKKIPAGQLHLFQGLNFRQMDHVHWVHITLVYITTNEIVNAYSFFCFTDCPLQRQRLTHLYGYLFSCL